MTDRHSYMRRPDHSGDLKAALDAYYRMPRSTLVATFPTRKPRLPITNDRQGAPNIPCVLPISHDRDGSISSFRKVSIAQFPPGHLSSFFIEPNRRDRRLEKEPQTNTGDMAWLITTVEALDQERAGLKARLEALEREVANSVKRRDSVEIGTPAKGGSMKCYLDAAGDPKANDMIVLELRRVLSIAGGIPQPKQEAGP